MNRLCAKKMGVSSKFSPNLGMGKGVIEAILDGARQIAVPAFVSTLCICIVFVPVSFLTGAAKYLFTPLALAVVLAMSASYLLSRTLVPTMIRYLIPAELRLYQGPEGEAEVIRRGTDLARPSPLSSRIRAPARRILRPA